MLADDDDENKFAFAIHKDLNIEVKIVNCELSSPSSYPDTVDPILFTAL